MSEQNKKDNKNKVLKVELTDENINKALDTLGINPADLNKAIETDEKEEVKEDVVEKAAEKSEESSDKIEKSEEKEEGGEKEDKEKEDKEEKEEGGEKEDKGKIGDRDEKKEESTEEKEEKKEEKDEVEKSVKTPIEVKTDLIDEMEKSIDQKLGLLTNINIKLTEKLSKALKTLGALEGVIDEKIEKALDNVDNQIEKSISDKITGFDKSGEIEKNTELLKSMNSRLEKVEKTSQGRRSVTATQFISKSVGAEKKEEDNGTTLSITRDKKQISDLLLTKSGIGSGGPINKAYQDAVIQFEGGSTLSKAIMNDLSKSEGIQFIS